MELKELRIGNLINYKFTPDQEEVKAITVTDFALSEKIYSKNFRPIGITNDWLKGFGFILVPKLMYNYWALHIPHYTYNGLSTSLKLSISEGSNKLFINDSFLMYCEHVHQLQNLFHSITGKELEIKEPAQQN